MQSNVEIGWSDPCNQPKASIYEVEMITLIIGPKNYLVFPDIFTDIGHTLAHYLFTGQYETPKPDPDTWNSSVHTLEYCRAIIAYSASSVYGLDGLKLLARNVMLRHARSTPISDILNMASAVSPKLYKDDKWLEMHIEHSLSDAFAVDENVFKTDSFQRYMGRNCEFGKLLLNAMANIYSREIDSLRWETKKGVCANCAENVPTAGKEKIVPTSRSASGWTAPSPRLSFQKANKEDEGSLISSVRHSSKWEELVMTPATDSWNGYWNDS